MWRWLLGRSRSAPRATTADSPQLSRAQTLGGNEQDRQQRQSSITASVELFERLSHPTNSQRFTPSVKYRWLSCARVVLLRSRSLAAADPLTSCADHGVF
jgi:hypothetical protein